MGFSLVFQVAEALQKATVNPAETNNVPPPDLWNLDVKPKQEWEGDEKLLGKNILHLYFEEGRLGPSVTVGD